MLEVATYILLPFGGAGNLQSFRPAALLSTYALHLKFEVCHGRDIRLGTADMQEREQRLALKGDQVRCPERHLEAAGCLSGVNGLLRLHLDKRDSAQHHPDSSPI